MKTDTDKYEKMKKKGNKMNLKIKKKNDIAMLEEMWRQKREQQRRYRAKKNPKTKQKTKNKHRKPVHPIKQ
jgi:hypothetical protein